MRKEFKMTEKQVKDILQASKPVPYLVFDGRGPTSPQEIANMAWRKLGEELGFDYMTVQPISGKGQEYFTAESKAS